MNGQELKTKKWEMLCTRTTKILKHENLRIYSENNK